MAIFFIEDTQDNHVLINGITYSKQNLFVEMSENENFALKRKVGNVNEYIFSFVPYNEISLKDKQGNEVNVSSFHQMLSSIKGIVAYNHKKIQAINFTFINPLTVSKSVSGKIIVFPIDARVNYAIQSGTLPNGLSLNTSTGEIVGTPIVTGTFDVTIKAIGTGDYTGEVEKGLSISVEKITIEKVDYQPAYSFAVNSSSSIFPSACPDGATISYSILSGALPNGLLLNASTGEIAGTPNTKGNFSVNIKAIGTGIYVGEHTSSMNIEILGAGYSNSIEGFVSDFNESDRYFYFAYIINGEHKIERQKEGNIQQATNVTDINIDWDNRLNLDYVDVYTTNNPTN